jgi:CRISPR type IV-associated protein Csf3
MIAKLRAYKPDPGRYEPCKVTFELGSPVLLATPWIMLDGLLAYAMAQDIIGETWHEINYREPLPIAENIELPLRRITFGNTFVNAASCSRFNPTSSSTTRIRKRAAADALVYLDDAPSRIDTVRGDLKSYDMIVPSISARTCEFHAVGDVVEIRRLCGMIDCLGKKRALGFGRVLQYSVDLEEQDRSFLLEPGEQVNKPIPVAALDLLGLARLKVKPVAMLSCRPPYWDPGGMVPCVCPEGF